MPGLRKVDLAIAASLPCGYEARHLKDIYPLESFPIGNQGQRVYGNSPWCLFIDGERHEPQIELLSQIYEDNNGKGLARAKGIVERKKRAIRPCGDFKDLAMLCSYLIKMGVMRSMPKSVIDKESTNGAVKASTALEALTTEKTPTKSTGNTGSHLLKLESAPNAVLAHWASQSLGYFGSTEVALKAFGLVLNAIEAAETEFNTRKEEIVASLASLPGVNAEKVAKSIDSDKRQAVLAIVEKIDLPKPVNGNAE